MPPCPDPPCLCSPALPSEGLCPCHSPVRHPSTTPLPPPPSRPSSVDSLSKPQQWQRTALPGLPRTQPQAPAPPPTPKRRLLDPCHVWAHIRQWDTTEQPWWCRGVMQVQWPRQGFAPWATNCCAQQRSPQINVFSSSLTLCATVSGVGGGRYSFLPQRLCAGPCSPLCDAAARPAWGRKAPVLCPGLALCKSQGLKLLLFQLPLALQRPLVPGPALSRHWPHQSNPSTKGCRAPPRLCAKTRCAPQNAALLRIHHHWHPWSRVPKCPRQSQPTPLLFCQGRTPRKAKGSHSLCSRAHPGPGQTPKAAQRVVPAPRTLPAMQLHAAPAA